MSWQQSEATPPATRPDPVRERTIVAIVLLACFAFILAITLGLKG